MSVSIKIFISIFLFLFYSLSIIKSQSLVTCGTFSKIYDPSIGESSAWYINDHAVVCGPDGWHLFGITHAEPANPIDEKNFAHATASAFTQQPWIKKTYALSYSPADNEVLLWAPHVIYSNGLYYMYYCVGAKNIDHTKFRMHLATSPDLWNWTRHTENPMVVDGFDGRDPMVIKLDSCWAMYYCATSGPNGGNHVVYMVQSTDLVHWGNRITVFTDTLTGTAGGPTESPFVVRRGSKYYLFTCTNAPYNNSRVMVSSSPYHWSADSVVGDFPAHAAEIARDLDGKWYITRAGWGEGGVYIAPLIWNDGLDSEVSSMPVPTAYKTQKIPGVVEFEDFDNGGAGVAYSDLTIGNAGGAYRPTESVDIESKAAGGYNINWIDSGEWFAYTVDIKARGKFTVNINYAAEGNGNEAIIYVDGADKSGIITFPSSGNLTTWANKSLDMQLVTGRHILKFFVKSTSGYFKLDKITFTEKDVLYPGNGTGLNKSIWSAPVGGRTWFKDSICSEIDPVINHTWSDVSPGCSVSKDFWNIRWQGQIQSLYTETYTFYLTMNDLGRVWIDNQLLLDGWNSSSTGTSLTGTVAMTAGQKVPIKVDLAEKSGDAYIKLEWGSASNAKEVIPQSQLYPLLNPNGIKNIKAKHFSFYPNPANDKLTINSENYTIKSIKITNLQGNIVHSDNKQFVGEKTIELNLQKGIYFISLTGNLPFSTQKLIVQKQTI